MYTNLVIVFNFIISQWSLSPQAFKDAVLAAAFAKCVLALVWWTTRVLVAKFPLNPALASFQKLLNTRPAKLVVLGMEEGWHPDFGFPVYWMYLEGRDVVHIGKSAEHAGENQKTYLGRLGQARGAGTGAIDHIAFRAKGLEGTMAHLRRHHIEFNERRAN